MESSLRGDLFVRIHYQRFYCMLTIVLLIGILFVDGWFCSIRYFNSSIAARLPTILFITETPNCLGNSWFQPWWSSPIFLPVYRILPIFIPPIAVSAFQVNSNTNSTRQLKYKLHHYIVTYHSLMILKIISHVWHCGSFLSELMEAKNP